MVLNCRISLHTFVEAFKQTAGINSTITLPAIGMMHSVPQEEVDYGLSVLRESILAFERAKGVPVERSKAEMPFFRQDTRMLVGPEVEMFILPLYEQMVERPLDGEPTLIVSLDYKKLGEQCLFENYSLIACKSEKESFVRHYMAQLETEYDKFFYDEENTGFTADSRFFSLMCNACLEIKRQQPGEQKEWRLAALRFPEEASFRLDQDKLISYLPIELPVTCVKQIYLEDYKKQPLLYGTLNGFLKSKGLPAEQFLNLT